MCGMSHCSIGEKVLVAWAIYLYDTQGLLGLMVKRVKWGEVKWRKKKFWFVGGGLLGGDIEG